MSRLENWGFRKADVEGYIKKIQHINTTELTDLTKSLELIQQESDMLCQEISSLTQTNSNSPSVIASEIALKRVDIIIRFIEQTLGKDVLDLQNSAHEKLISLEHNINELYRVSKKAKQELDPGLFNIDHDQDATEYEKSANAPGVDVWTSSSEQVVEEISSYWDYVPGWEEEPERNDVYQDVAAAVEDVPCDGVGPVEEDLHEDSQARVRVKINAVRDKYVLGKVAGEDLLDNTGRVIIQKNSMITETVMETAVRDGKLAELIINMVIPGQEE